MSELDVDLFNLGMSEEAQPLMAAVQQHINNNVVPIMEEFEALDDEKDDEWTWHPRQLELLEGAKDKAKAAGLWNFFLPDSDIGQGLTNLDYAYIAAELGKHSLASESLNCSAPDTGNMEVLEHCGTPEQKEKWLEPLLNGEIRSSYVMTEPALPSSDARNISTSAVRDGDDYVINGEKYWISNVADPRTKIMIVMVKTDPDAAPNRQQSQILVPTDTEGVEIIGPMDVFGDTHPPRGHMHMRFNNVRVPKENILRGEGRGFEISQLRLGPGRIHHCMRSIGSAQLALELMCQRVTERKTFGRMLSDRSSIRMEIAKSYCDIEQARLLTLKAADAIDRVGAKNAKDLIAAIKVVAPQMAQTVADRAIQIFGGMGVSDDVPLAGILATQRFIRLADGPDEVHASQLGKFKVGQYAKLGAGWNDVPTD